VGEIQLANVMNASRLRQGIDYELQVTATNEDGRSLRPDCVVNLPNGIKLAVDAKFPYDAFERSLDEEDADARRELQSKHARDLRSHVKTLREKSYWEAVSPSPEFVVCFIPSDFAMSAALDADRICWPSRRTSESSSSGRRTCCRCCGRLASWSINNRSP